MRIAIDGQTALGQKTGFGFYVDNLIRTLPKIAKNDQLITLTPNTEKDLSTIQRFWWDQVNLPRLLKHEQVDVFHQPSFSAPINYRGKVVVTIHDVISLFHTDIPFVSRQYYAKWMPFSYRFADHFITISEHSKKDIIAKLGIPADKISVIYLAAGEEYKKPVRPSDQERVRQKYHLERPYILNVGTLNPRKNLEFLVRVFAEVKKRLKTDHCLAIAGKKGWQYDQLFKLVTELGLQNDVVFLGYVADKDKPALYQSATAFVFPSLYEGFGLPPVEAMLSGVPTISSNTSSLPEVMGKSGIMLSPHDESGWAHAITKVLTDADLRHKMSIEGKEQASQFSWERCARETLEVYHQVGQKN